MSKQIGIVLCGVGTVGTGVIELLAKNNQAIVEKTGKDIKIVSACVRNVKKAQEKLSSDVLVTDDWKKAIEHPACDIVVELIGGETTANEIANATLTAGKPLITANKALLATNGKELFATAKKHNTTISFEAAVAGCVPAIRVLRHTLAGDNITSITGIVNGTCNYILTRMSKDAMNFTDALAKASELGYAEADPSLDIDGFDAAHKAVIMSWLTFGSPLSMDKVPVSGVRNCDTIDEQYANIFGYTLKLIASARHSKHGVETEVSLALVDAKSNLAGIENNTNAISIMSDGCGEILLVGAGAGALPTGAAVLSDIIEVVNGHASLPTPPAQTNRVQLEELSRQAYLRLHVKDTKGVVAKITAVLSDAELSIEAIHQSESQSNEPADIAILLHEAQWKQIQKVQEQLANMDEVIDQPVLYPVLLPHFQN